MDIVSELLKFLLPSLVIFGVCYTLIRSFFNQQESIRMMELKTRNSQTILPMRLQAYERVTLLLERISPNNLLIRVNRPGISAAEFKIELINDINNEFNHNLSQQIYISPQAWSLIRAVREQVVNLINSEYSHLPADAKAIDLSKAVFERMIKDQEIPTQKALDFLKKEVQLNFEF
jgi:hypothetical protein